MNELVPTIHTPLFRNEDDYNKEFKDENHE